MTTEKATREDVLALELMSSFSTEWDTAITVCEVYPILAGDCTSAFRTLENVGPGEDAPAFAKFVAFASIFLWLAVIVLGRYIPFGEVT